MENEPKSSIELILEANGYKLFSGCAIHKSDKTQPSKLGIIAEFPNETSNPTIIVITSSSEDSKSYIAASYVPEGYKHTSGDE